LWASACSGRQSTSSESCHHNNDINNGLQTFSKAILNLAKTDDEERQRMFLMHLNSLLTTSLPETSSSPPSLFATKVAMRLQNLDFDTFSEYSQVEDLECRKFGESLGNAIWNSRKTIEEKRDMLENPTSLEAYYNAFPQMLQFFFEGLIESIMRNKHTVSVRKAKQRGQKPSEFNMPSVMKITIFLSVILSIAFRSWKIWLTHVLSSFCQKPKMIT